MLPISEDRTVLSFLSPRLLIVQFLHNGDAGQKTEDSFVLRNGGHFCPQKIVLRYTFEGRLK